MVEIYFVQSIRFLFGSLHQMYSVVIPLKTRLRERKNEVNKRNPFSCPFNQFQVPLQGPFQGSTQGPV